MSFVEKKTYLHKPIARNIILTFLPILIGGLLSALGNWNPQETPWFTFKVILLIFTILAEIIAVTKYTKWDFEKEANINKLQENFDNLMSEKNLLVKENKALKQELNDFAELLKRTAHSLNTIAHQIQEKGQIDLSIWNARSSCSEICAQALGVLRLLASAGNDFSVNYIQKISIDGIDYLEMSGIAGTTDIPDINYSKKNAEELNSYYYGKLLSGSSPDIVILENEEAIRANFAYPKIGSAAQHKYTQYIAVPIVCNKRKPVGLLQIVAHKNSIIAHTKEELYDIAKNHFIPLGICAMFMSKVEKAATAIPKTVEG